MGAPLVGLYIGADKTLRRVEIDPDNFLPEVYALLGVDMIELVKVYNGLTNELGCIMYVDEEGRIKDSPILNEYATEFANYLDDDARHSLYGNVLVLHGIDREGNEVGLIDPLIGMVLLGIKLATGEKVDLESDV